MFDSAAIECSERMHAMFNYYWKISGSEEHFFDAPFQCMSPITCNRALDIIHFEEELDRSQW